MTASPAARWANYAIEAWGLGTFMFVAGSIAVGLGLLPPALVAWLMAHRLASRAVFGVAMGLTAMAIVYSPWGARSGAHLNPTLTLTYAWLGKIRPADAVAYAIAQFAGGAAGFALIAALAGHRLIDPPTRAIVTRPGDAGTPAAFAGEAIIAFVLMSTVLAVSNAPRRIARFTGVAAGILVALFITFESPFSGTSMNPARTLASAVVAHDFTGVWIYFTAPPLGMILAAVLFVTLRGRSAVRCGRLNHGGTAPCTFRCSYATPAAPNSARR